jgi:5-methyltetrahydropteroyltriglutamate--homocysteine methyltransferase
MSVVEEVAPVVKARVPARAEGVGSLLRPDAMTEPFMKAYGRGVYSDDGSDQRRTALAELEELAHEITPELVRRQIDAGLDVVTDGEMRRSFFINSLMDAVGGIDLKTEETSSEAEFGKGLSDHADEKPAPPPVPVVIDRIFKRANPALGEAQTLSAITPFPKKLTFPAASFFYYKMVIEVGEPYNSRDEFVDDIIKVQRELIDEVIAAGVKHIQFDFPLYPMLVDATANERAAEIGETVETLLQKALDADAKMVAELPDDVTTAMHICRGNEVRFFSGSLEPFAERLFQLPYDRFLIEMHDTEHDGPYDLIRHVPAPKVMVMGLVSTKVATVESEDDLLRRMDTAGSFLDLSQLAISPQCGFASTWRGQGYGEEVQWQKLELIGRVADRLWGTR